MLKSFADAFRGIFLLVKSERNFQIHVAALICVSIAGIYFDINRFEWLFIILISALVMGLEGANTALEKLCDEVTEERKESIRNIKDIAAGSVLIASISALVIAGLIFWKHLI
ncbi:MAG: diacylglycerol kinase family protein [Crocinitomicaceae bacterium]|nr:diacylglycerol kinase family protein [Crocinitomicaceae bacterium]